jgi:phage shock protein C
MSIDTSNLDRDPSRGFYRDRENGWIFGVCAGVADFFNFRIGTVRVIAIICLLVFFLPTILIYAAATLLFREKPLTYTGRRCHEYEFWRRRHCEDHWSGR